MFEIRIAARTRGAFLATVALTAAWSGAGTVALAHAYVVAAEPSMDARLSTPPRTIAITFDEPVDLFDRDAIEVFDTGGKRVDLRDAAVDPEDAARVVAHLRPGLDRGSYTVRWRVISADTHVVHGSYSIGVGVPPGKVPSNDVEASPFDPSMPLAATLRWLALLGALLVAGAVVLRLFAMKRLIGLQAALDAPAYGAAVAGCATVLIVAIPSLLVQALAASAGLLSPAAVAATVMHSLWGHALVVRVVAAVCVLAVAYGRRSDWSRAALPLVALLLGTFSVAGHAAAVNGWGWRILAEANDYIHLWAVAAWIGGVLVMTIALPRVLAPLDTLERRTALPTLFAAFTPLAIVCAVISIATGTIASLLHVPAVTDLLGSVYGRALCVKVALVALLLLLGYRQFRTGLGRDDARAIVWLRGEALVALGVLVCSAILVGQAPPQTPMPGSPAMQMSMKGP